MMYQVFLGISLGIALSIDALAIAVCEGLTFSKKDLIKNSLIIAFFFGLFQGVMPLMGWWLMEMLGKWFGKLDQFDHFIAFAILVILGLKLILSDSEHEAKKFSIKSILVLAIATSLDAFFAGASLAGQSYIFLIVFLIFLITFIACLFGAIFGKYLGALVEKYANVIGGIALILIGLNIMLQGIL